MDDEEYIPGFEHVQKGYGGKIAKLCGFVHVDEATRAKNYEEALKMVAWYEEGREKARQEMIKKGLIGPDD